MAHNVTEKSSISSLSDEQIENRAQFVLKSCFFQPLFLEDLHQDFYEVVKSDDKISISMFPMIVKVIKTGSRADRTYLAESDIDYMYEVGPLSVLTKSKKNYTKVPAGSSDESLYLCSTENRGFYRIQDKDKGYMYPRVMQSKLAPIIRDVKQIAFQEESKATLPLNNRNSYRKNIKNFDENLSDEDTVIAFKCMEWPRDIWEDFSDRNPKHIEDLMPVLKEIHLYLVSKAHPKSERPWIEWRISFSLVEKEIYLRLPYILRKVYLLCKTLTSKWKDQYKFNSYLLKTVFLWMLEEWGKRNKTYKEDDILDMIADVFLYMSKCYEKRQLPMYFIPEMNLLQQYPTTSYENLNLEKEQERVENFDQILRQLANKKSMINIIVKYFPGSFQRNRMAPHRRYLRSMDDTIFDLQGNGDDDPKCEEDVLQFQLKLYLKLLEALNSVSYNHASYDILYSLYHLWVFRSKYLSEKDIQFQFLIKYHKSIIDFSRRPEIAHQINVPPGENRLCSEPYFVFLRNKFHYSRSDFMKHLDFGNGELELQEMLIDGSLERVLYSKFPSISSIEYQQYLQYYSFKSYREQLGDKKRSKEVQTIMQTMFFYENDKIFHNLVDKLNDYFINKIVSTEDRTFEFLNSINFPGTAFYLTDKLLVQMCEMYSYGFTAKKFALPTPASYMSYTSQLALNLESTITRITDGGRFDKWGYTFKTGNSYNYRTYEDRLHNTFLLNLEESNDEILPKWVISEEKGDLDQVSAS